MDDDLKNINTKGFWWKRFFYNVTGANLDYEVGPNWFASVMGTGIIANAAASLPLFSNNLSEFCPCYLVPCFLNADRSRACNELFPVSTAECMD